MSASKQWIAFCEADADFRTASLLIDELLRLRGAPWVAEELDREPADVRRWHEDRPGRAWFDVHSIYDLAKRLGVQLSYGHFDGKPAEAGARMLDTIFRIVRRLQQKPHALAFEAVVVIWDMDRQRRQRKAGVEQAAQSGSLPSGIALVVGCPDPMRETWVLAGFEPLDTREEALLKASHRRLGFWPNQSPHELTAENEQALRHAKRVLQADLGVTDWEREALCLRIPDESVRLRLATRGAKCGLEKYLNDVERHLVSLVDRSFRLPESSASTDVRGS